MKGRVFVMLSGGVDSSVAALLLKKQGYNVTGVYFKRYKPDGNKELCKQDGQSAKKVAEQLGIDFKVWDFEKEYKEKVFDYLISSYKKGETPNPDIICNREIKFGIFAKRAFAEGADFIASGHYAKIASCVLCPVRLCFAGSKYFFAKPGLKEAKDKNKDQSYFLSQVNKDVLKRVIFPLHNLTKNQTRQIAKKAGLHTAGRKESQGICFVGKKLDFKEFLSGFIDEQEGFVYDTNGRKIAKHKGVQFYTTGERRGFDILPEIKGPNSEALYILKKDIPENKLIAGTRKELEEYSKSIVKISADTLNLFLPIKSDRTYFARIRHRGEKVKCKAKIAGSELVVYPKAGVFAPAEGQFIALYDKDILVASAKIKNIESKML